MIIGSSLNGVMSREHPRQGVGDLKKAKFDAAFLDLGLYCDEKELEYTGRKTLRGDSLNGIVAGSPDQLCEVTKNLRQVCKQNSLQVALMRAPHLAFGTKRDDLNEKIYELACESILLCEKMQCHALIVRPWFAGLTGKESKGVSHTYYLSLAKLAKEHDVMLLLENTCKNVGGHSVRGLCADSKEAADWVDELNEEVGELRFGFCLNTEVCTLCGQQIREMIPVLGSRLKAVILGDGDGYNEGAHLPFTYSNCGLPETDWRGLVSGLRELCYDGMLILDLEETARAFSPLLRPHLLELAYEEAKYFKWQIELEQTIRKYKKIVLFGAGRMCENYMKVYGDKYLPLYTCDNNASLWGKILYGLEVKSPEALKDLADDHAVLICNTYYREIETQLRKLGVAQIEYFNDEYL